MRSSDLATTADLWSTTHAALCQGRWGVARTLLEQLSNRHDVRDTLSDLESYALVSGQPLTDELFAAVSFRIGFVNRIALLTQHAL